MLARPNAATTLPGPAAATLRIANRSIAWHVLEALNAAGISDVAVLGPSAAVTEIRRTIEDDGSRCDVAYLPYEGDGDLLEMLRLAVPFVEESPCIVHAAHGLLGEPLAPLCDQLLRPDHPDVVLLVHSPSKARHPLRPAVRRLLGLSQAAATNLTAAGVGLLGRKGLELVCASPASSDLELRLTAIASEAARAGGHLYGKPVHRWLGYSGDPVDLLELNRMVLDQMRAGETPTRTGSRIEGRVVIHPSAHISSSVIVGPVIIGPGTRVENAYIGPYTAVGGNVYIDGAEIARSIILDDAKIMHVSARIEGSTIGRGARIFRDFGLPRAMRLHVGEGVEVVLN